MQYDAEQTANVEAALAEELATVKVADVGVSAPARLGKRSTAPPTDPSLQVLSRYVAPLHATEIL
jgi:hypothetical protein